MEKKEKSQSLYGKVLSFLRHPFFRSFTNVLTHGGTHFIVLLIVLVASVYYGFMRNQNYITPHTMGIHLGWASSQDSVIQKIYPGYSPDDSIDNIRLHILLNSDKIIAQTKGKYQNGIVIEFDGKVKTRDFFDYTGKNIISGYKDSTVVSVFNDPELKSYDAVVKMNLLPKGDTEYKDSITEDGKRVVVVTKKVLVSDSSGVKNTLNVSDSIVHSNVRPLKGDVVSVSMFPIDYQGYLDQRTKYYVNIYSNEIGFEEDNPYYYYYFNIPTTKNAEIKSIDFQVSDSIEHSTYGMVYTKGKNLQYNYIYPEPDVIGNGRIVYYSKEKKEAIRKNQGVIIQAVDVNAANKQNRKAFLYSVLIGTGLAFALDIIVQLIKELKRLHRKTE